MKKNFISFLAIAVTMPLMCMCSKSETPEPAVKNKVLINVNAVDNNKIALTQGNAKMDLAWEAGDQITVIGNTSEVYDIVAGFTAHEAQFLGNEVEGTSFDVLYPGKYTTKADILSRSYADQIQNSNGSTAHLEYNALASGLESYKNVSFTKASGALINSVLKLVIKMPEDVTEVSSISLSAPEAIFYATNDNDVPLSSLSLGFTNTQVDANGKLTAYIMTSWQDVTIPANTKLTLKVTTPGTGYYGKTFSSSDALALNSGAVLDIDISDATVMTYKLEGQGTQSEPYLLYNKKDMNLVKSYIKSTGVSYFKMMNDIDMEGAEWSALTPSGYAVDFDGDGHTWSNMTIPAQAYASIFGILNGEVHDITFDKITVNQNGTATNACGVIAGYLGNTSGVASGNVKNVTITNSSVTYDVAKGAPVGGVAGVFAKGSVDGVVIDSNTTISQKFSNSSTSYCAIGGIIGYTNNNGNPATIKNCKCSASIVCTNTVAPTTAVNHSIGGIVGRIGLRVADTVESCVFSGTISVPSICSYVGGIVGTAYTKTGCVIKRCENKASFSLSSVKYVGGIVGYMNQGVISECCNSGNIGGNESVGGIVGSLRAGTSSAYNIVKDCCNTGDIYVETAGLIGGGIVGDMLEYATVSRVWSTGAVSDSRGCGGIIGRSSNGKTGAKGANYNNNFYSLISYPSSISSKGNADHYSSGAIIGYTATLFTAYGCYRSSTIADNFTCNYNPSGVDLIGNQGVNINTTTGVTKCIGDGTTTGQKNWFPYHGDAAGTEYTSIAKVVKYINDNADTKFHANCVFSTDIWDIPADGNPTLKNLPE